MPNCLSVLLVSKPNSHFPVLTCCFTLHLAISFEHGAPPPPVSSALIFHFSSMHGHSHKDGISSSISVFLPFAYSSDKRVLLFVCVFFFLLGKHVLHLDLEGSAYFVLSLPAYFRIPIFLSLVVCYVACCYISLIWPEASQRDSLFGYFHFVLPWFLVSGQGLLTLTVDCL